MKTKEIIQQLSSQKQIEKAKVLTLEGKEEEALEYLKSKINEQKHNILIYKEISLILQNQNKISEVIEMWNFGIKNNYSKISFYKEKALILEKTQKQEEALNCWNQGIDKNKNKYEFYKQKAILLEKQGKLSEMINNWDQAIHHDIKFQIIQYFQQKPQNSKLVVMKLLITGIILYSKIQVNSIFICKNPIYQKDMVNFKKSYHVGIMGLSQIYQILTFIYKKALIMLYLADALKRQGYELQIIDCWQKGIEWNPHNKLFYYEKTRALEEENLYEEIIMCWDLGMSNNKNIQWAILEKILALVKQGKTQEIINFWHSNDHYQKCEYYFYIKLTNSLIREAKFEEIIFIWQLGIESNPQNNQLYYLAKCNALEKQNRFQEIIECWNDGIKQFANNFYYYDQKAKALEKQQRIQEILVCWDEGILNNQLNLQFYKAKMKALEKMKKFQEIIECIDVGISQKSNESIDLVLHLQLENYEAQTHYGYPLGSTLNFYLEKGYALQKQGRWLDIIKNWEEAIQKITINSQFYLNNSQYFFHKLADSLIQFQLNKKALIYYRFIYNLGFEKQLREKI